MDSMGQLLRTTRERKRLSLSYVAAQTHIKLQFLELMERDDLSRMPAPMYAKGFIRLYANYLGLDPAPMVQEYIDVQSGRRPARAPAAPVPAPRAAEPEPEPEPGPEPVPEPEVEVEEAEGAGEEEPMAPAPVPPRRPRPPRKPRRPIKLPDLSFVWKAVAGLPWRGLLTAVAVLLVAVLLVNSLVRCARRAASEPEFARPAGLKKGVPAVIQEPPEPYLPLPSEAAESAR